MASPIAKTCSVAHRAFLLSAMLVGVSVHASPLSNEDVSVIGTVMHKLEMAYYQGDFETLADLTSDRLLNAVGGRARYIESVKTALKLVEAQGGAQLVSYQFGAPECPAQKGDFLVCIVKETTVIDMAGQRMRVEGFSAAVRPKAGRQWKAIGGKGISQNPRVLSVLFPGFPASFVPPPYVSYPVSAGAGNAGKPPSGEHRL